MTSNLVKKELKSVIRNHNCCGCGGCAVFDADGNTPMLRTAMGPIPDLTHSELHEDALKICPGIGINYPELYIQHYKKTPENWLHGMIQKVRIGYAGDTGIRRRGASGGIITSVLLHLLKQKKINGVVCVQQGIPTPLEASAIIARTEEDIIASMQSVYIPVSILDILNEFIEGEEYAMVCLPEQSATLRKMQSLNHPRALQVKYVLGPYTGTALYPSAINSFLRSRRISRKDKVTSLKWREGEWPGYLQIKTESGKILKSKKVYYNYLIPFFITHTSLRSMDFVNEFADLAVGDAWSPEFEKEGKGFSVFVTRTPEMEAIIDEMILTKQISADIEDKDQAISMHGHMLDFKKRGAYIRNKMRRILGHPVPDYGYRPVKISFSRKLTELFISLIFLLAGNSFSRFLMSLIPEKIMGPLFDFWRLKWKKLSKPTKRKGLSNYEIKITNSHV